MYPRPTLAAGDSLLMAQSNFKRDKAFLDLSFSFPFALSTRLVRCLGNIMQIAIC